MPLDPAFIADCPYGPGGLLLDEITQVDRATSTLVARMPTHPDLPLTREQRAHPVFHPHHVSGALMVHVTAILGFAHAYFVLDLRHAAGWIGYGTHIHEAKFKKLGEIGPPIELVCTATNVRRIQKSIVARYRFRFMQNGALIYEGDQTAIWSQVPREGVAA
jgi:hypothetical protein